MFCSANTLISSQGHTFEVMCNDMQSTLFGYVEMQAAGVLKRTILIFIHLVQIRNAYST